MVSIRGFVFEWINEFVAVLVTTCNKNDKISIDEKRTTMTFDFFYFLKRSLLSLTY